MFDKLDNTYSNIIIEFGIVGYSEEDIIKRGFNSENNLPLNLLYSYPNQQSKDTELIIQMMFPDDEHKISSPKFFSLTLTNEKGNRTFLYCLKFPEKYIFNKENKYVEVPLVIYIKSLKEDLESFKQLLYAINQIIVNDNLEKIVQEPLMINNYKKIQLINLLYFLFCLPHTSPHTLVKLKLNQELDNILKLNETIDFYFSSNCEIPCNKNDTDINNLFLILDQSIIIKVIFSILTENKIIFVASQAYLLHLIISCFLKLIFPFKWHYPCITVLTKDNLEFLEIPSPYIFGVLSSHLSTKDLTDEYSRTIIVDCDTNEIFGYNRLEPYEPPLMTIKKHLDDKKKKDKKKENETKLEINNIESNNFTQGNNLIIIKKNVIMKYENLLSGKKKKLVFNYDNNIIIDTQKSQLFIDKNDIFIDSNDWKWLRTYIQLVRNPELFNLDSFDFKNKKKNNILLNDDEDNPILPNRPFSYNIQNIILTFILKKLTFQESDFMTIFKKTTLYTEYEDTSKEFENDKRKVIVQNIKETKNEPRSIENSFNIEYVLKQFNAQEIIDKLKSKIGSNNQKLNKSIYQDLKNIFNDYLQIKEEIINQNNDDNNKYKNNNIFNKNRKYSEKTLLEKIKLDINMNKPNKNLYKHTKTNTTLLNETSGQNKYILLGFDNSEYAFQFYSKNGFINFANKLDYFLQEEKIDIKDIIYNKNMNYQILNILNKYLSEEENKNEKKEEALLDKRESNEDNNDINKIKLRQKIGVSIVSEKKEEENDIDNISNSSVEIKKGEDYDFTDNLFNINSEQDKIFNFENNNNLINKENQIINFSNFDLDEELNKEKEKKEINHLMQFYLFLAFYLEKAKNDRNSLKFFFNNLSLDNHIIKSNFNDIKNEDDNNDLYEIIEKEENDEKEQKLKIDKIIIKLYILAYNNSDKKHRDFPYFSFYNLLNKISLEDLKSFYSLFDSYKEDFELGFIYSTIIIEKQQEEIKNYRKLISFDNKSKIKLNKEEEKHSEDYTRRSESNIIKNKIKINFIDENYKRQTIQNTIKKDFIEDINKNNNKIKEEKDPLLIINEIGELINQEIINEEINNFNIVGKNSNEILEEMHSIFIKHEKLKELIIDLKYINLNSINTKKKCFIFWLNCFNFLIIYIIFIEKLNLNEEKSWKQFFNTLYLNIGGKIFSFNDIQYILFKKPNFLSSTYKPNDFIKKLNIDKIKGELKLEEKDKMIPFILYLPIKGFLKPILFNEKNIEIDINKRMKEYFDKYIVFDKNNYLWYNDLILKFYSNIFGKEINKYEKFFKPELFKVIKNRKYKQTNPKKLEWQLNFDNLI